MRALGVLALLTAALAVQTTLSSVVVRGTVAVDLVLVVVVYAALAYGPVTGLLTGTFGGLVQDGLTTGILGMGGLAKTVVGFLAGRFATQFIVAATLPRFLVFAAATAVHALLFKGLYTLLGLRSFPDPFSDVALQAVGNGLVGVVGFKFAEWLPQFMERRRANRGMRVKR